MSRVKRVLIEATGPNKDWSRRSLSLAAGMGPDGVRNILSGRSGNPKADSLAGLATALGKDVSVFFSDDDNPWISAEVIKVIGRVEAGVWREQGEFFESEEHTLIVGPNPIPGGNRFGLIVDGYSMDRIFPPGTILDCVGIVKGKLLPRSGDLVIAERTSHDLRETTCKRLMIADSGAFELHSESTRPEFQQPIPIGSPDRDGSSDDEVRIIALVVGSYRSHFTSHA